MPSRFLGRLAGVLAALAIAVTTFAVTAVALPATPVAAQAGETTTTLPSSDRDLGNIIPKPNSGSPPVDAGDRGGWLQTSLFLALLVAVLVIIWMVWRQSRQARERRAAAGLDPVEVAKRRGVGVRTRRAPGEDRSDGPTEDS